jgi:hypothetical protein
MNNLVVKNKIFREKKGEKKKIIQFSANIVYFGPNLNQMWVQNRIPLTIQNY